MADISLVNNPWFAIASSLVSGAAAVVVTLLYSLRAERRHLKLDCLRRLVGARYVLSHGAHSTGAVEVFYMALNEAVIVFSANRKVLVALRTFHSNMDRPDRFEDNVIELFRTMADSLGLDSEALPNAMFLKPFRPTISTAASHSQREA